MAKSTDVKGVNRRADSKDSIVVPLEGSNEQLTLYIDTGKAGSKTKLSELVNFYKEFKTEGYEKRVKANNLLDQFMKKNMPKLKNAMIDLGISSKIIEEKLPGWEEKKKKENKTDVQSNKDDIMNEEHLNLANSLIGIKIGKYISEIDKIMTEANIPSQIINETISSKKGRGEMYKPIEAFDKNGNINEEYYNFVDRIMRVRLGKMSVVNPFKSNKKETIDISKTIDFKCNMYYENYNALLKFFSRFVYQTDITKVGKYNVDDVISDMSDMLHPNESQEELIKKPKTELLSTIEKVYNFVKEAKKNYVSISSVKKTIENLGDCIGFKAEDIQEASKEELLVKVNDAFNVMDQFRMENGYIIEDAATVLGKDLDKLQDLPKEGLMYIAETISSGVVEYIGQQMGLDGINVKDVSNEVIKTLTKNKELSELQNKDVKELVQSIEDSRKFLDVSKNQVVVSEASRGLEKVLLDYNKNKVFKLNYQPGDIALSSQSERKTSKGEKLDQNYIVLDNFIISNPASEVVETRIISERKAKEVVRTQETYYYFPGFDEMIVEELFRNFEDLRKKINDGNELLYKDFKFNVNYKICESKIKSYEFLKKGKNPITKLLRKIIVTKKAEGTIEKQVEELRKDVAKVRYDSERGVIVEDKEMKKDGFLLERTAFEQYEDIRKNLANKTIDGFFKANTVFAEVFSEYKDKFKDNVGYHINILNEIVGYHLTGKGLNPKERRKPKKLEWERKGSGLDYVVWKNGDKIYKICKSYKTRNIEEKPVTPEIEHRLMRKTGIGKKIAYTLGALSLLNLGLVYNQIIKSKSLSEATQKIIKLEGVQQMFKDGLESGKSKTQDSLSLRLAEKDSLIEVITEKDSIISRMAWVSMCREAGLDMDMTGKEIKAKQIELLKRYTPANKIMIGNIGVAKGIMPERQDYINAFKITGDTALINDTAICKLGYHEADTLYDSLVNVMGRYRQAGMLNRLEGPFYMSNAELKRFANKNPTNEPGYKHITVNYYKQLSKITSINHYGKMMEWLDYYVKKGWKIKFTDDQKSDAKRNIENFKKLKMYFDSTKQESGSIKKGKQDTGRVNP